MIRMVFSDMDGTLLDDRGELPPDFDEVIGELLARGVIFVPASGRQYSALIRQMGKYTDDFVFISENGSFAARNDEELFSHVMEKTDVIRALKTGLTMYPVLCGKRIAYVGEMWRPYLFEMEKFFTKNKVVDDLFAIAESEDIIKVAFCDAEYADAEHNIYGALTRLQGPVHVALSSNYWVDVMNPGVNKGTAVRRLQAMLDIPAEECAAFGDYLNDIEMLKAVKYGFAMENAHPAVKEIAPYRARSNADYGVTAKLREIFELR